VTYLITFTCYGCHLHGSVSGSVDREHNVRGTPLLEMDSARAAAEREAVDQAPYNLDQIRRDAVLEAIQEVNRTGSYGHAMAAHDFCGNLNTSWRPFGRVPYFSRMSGIRSLTVAALLRPNTHFYVVHPRAIVS
jgi:hypothetical protein